MALQFGLGLLSQWRIGLGCSHCAHFSFDGSCLRQAAELEDNRSRSRPAGADGSVSRMVIRFAGLPTTLAIAGEATLSAGERSAVD
jgi:hypothetical protein